VSVSSASVIGDAEAVGRRLSGRRVVGLDYVDGGPVALGVVLVAAERPENLIGAEGRGRGLATERAGDVPRTDAPGPWWAAPLGD
jgi:hypothetical protein